MRRMMALAELLPDVDVPRDIVVRGLTLDSRSVQPGDAFVAIAGFGAHGLNFAAQPLGVAAELQQGEALRREQRHHVAQRRGVMVFDQVHAAAIQLSSSKAGTRANSRWLWVTRVRPSLRAWAAMCRSFSLMGWPARSNAVRIWP